MSSTYSPSLRIELIGTGDQSGLWGDTTNNNLGGLIEQAITGYQSIAMVDANYTLTALNGSVDQARNAILEFTSIGSLSATRNVIIPAVEKTYIVKNSTTGGQSITVKTTSGTGITIINGGTTSVYCDGTNVYQSSQYFPSLSVDSLTIKPTTATGTGLIVLQTNPAITSPTISTPTISNQVSTGGSLTNVSVVNGTISSLASALAVAYGGTGALNATDARTNLNVPARDGTGASGTWGINISGLAANASAATYATSAGSATTATTATTANALNTANNYTVQGLTAQAGLQGVTVAAQGYGVRVLGNVADSNALLQFTNNAGSAQWSSLTATNGLLHCSTNMSATGTIAASVGFVGDLAGTAQYAAYATTQAGGTNNTTVATTAFVQSAIAGAVSPPFPAGTRMPFAQLSAPTGWTQVNDDTTNDRMLRVVNGSGAGTGGVQSPILMNVVPSHTHTYSATSSTENATHYHAFSATTGNQSADHYHAFSGTSSAGSPHSHGVSDPGHTHTLKGWAGNDVNFGTYNLSTDDQYGGPTAANGIDGNYTGISINNESAHTHTYSGNTTGVSVGHNHAVTGNTGNESAVHAHTVAGTTDSGSSATNWQPRYLNLIICQKN